MKTTILVTGANGQIGSVLVPRLQEAFGFNNVIASDLTKSNNDNCIFEELDATNAKKMHDIVTKYKVTQIYHLAAILSAKGEESPLLTWNINMITLMNVLEVARIHGLEKVFYPSSIAVFGDLAEKNNTPQASFLNPATAYGISKASGENWAQYYSLKYGLDIRSLRFPGIISYQAVPGGGTTDYAVDIYHKAVLKERFTCFLRKDTKLPMMYIDDALRGTIEFMETPKALIKTKTSYNLAAVSYTPEDVALSIKKYLPDFEIDYNPDYRQGIADNWPRAIDDKEAKNDWNWECEFDLQAITKIMLTSLSAKYKKETTGESLKVLIS